MSIRDCLSTLELAAYRAGEDPDALTERHLADCLRCRALLAALPELEVPAGGVFDTSPPGTASREVPERPTELKTGQLWTATLEGQPDWREIVVVLAKQPAVDNNELALVAPVHTSLDEATSSDVIVDDSPLGYPHLVSVALQGVILADQLESYLGRLERTAREALANIYHALLAGSDPAANARTALPLAGPDDPRTSGRSARIDQLRPLFAAADRLLGHETDDSEEITFGAILADAIVGDEWDRPSLVIAAGVEDDGFERMLRDQLDLTDQSDLADVQRVIKVIRLDDWRDPVRRSLIRSPGGERIATGGTDLAIAARTFAGVPEIERERDLMRGQSAINQSTEARQRAIESYLRSLEKELDDSG